MTRAWHFVGTTLRDGRPVPPDGAWLEHAGPLELCESGLHASEDVFDAVRYAPGSVLCRVEVDGTILRDTDKLVASRRRIVARMDATDLLRLFARQCASDVLHLWDAPDVVRQYLATGDETLRDAACAAAAAAGWDAVGAAAWVAAWAAARAAAGAAAGAVWTADWDAARDAQRQRLLALVTAAFAEQGVTL